MRQISYLSFPLRCCRRGTYHVTAEPRTGHGGEVRRPRVVLTTAYDSHSTELAWKQHQLASGKQDEREGSLR